jgi:hypothetical protein
VIPLTAGSDQQLAGPVHLIGLDIGLTSPASRTASQGRWDITSVAASPTTRGHVDPARHRLGRWPLTFDQGGNRTPFKPAAGPGITLPVDQLFQFFDDSWELSFLPDRDPAQPGGAPDARRAGVPRSDGRRGRRQAPRVGVRRP